MISFGRAEPVAVAKRGPPTRIFRSPSQKLERSLRRLKTLDRLLSLPKRSPERQKKLERARSLQRLAVKLGRHALSAKQPPR